MPTGTIRTITNSSHGWIARKDDRDLFWHIKFVEPDCNPRVGLAVEFDIAFDALSSMRGHAVNIRAAVDEEQSTQGALDV
jgi:cold shock CspA family protein